jgi:hypothetical protein
LARLLRLKLRHFRSHRNTTLHFQRLTFIRGLNKSGKSGVVLAILMALAGRNDVTDEGGRGWEDLIEEGAPQATIELEFEPYTIMVKLDRSVGRTFKVVFPNSTTIIGRHAQEWIAVNIATPDIVSACLNATRFFSMDKKDQAALLAQVLLPATLEIEPAVGDWLKANNLSIVLRPSLFATIEATYKAIADARTEVNAKLRDLKNIEEPEQPTSTRDDVKAKVNALRAKEATAISELVGAGTSIENAQRESANLESLDRQIAEKQEQLNATTTVATLLSLDERAALLAVANKAQDHYQLSGYLSTYQAQLQRIAEALEHLMYATESGTCPTCKQPITAEIRDTLFGPLQAERDDLNGKILAIQHRFNADGNPAAANQRLQVDNDAIANRARITETLDHLRVQRAQCEERIAKQRLPPATGEGSVAQLTAALDSLKQRIVKDLDSLVKVVELEDRHAEYKKQIARREAAELRHAELEKLLAYFGPTGIKAKLIADRLDIFTKRVNAILQFWDYEMEFSIDPFLIRIHEFDSVISLSPRQLSASEMYRMGVAFGTAIAQWTGFNMLICDGADILDKPDKWQLAQALLHSDLDQAIVCSTGIAGTFTAGGTAFYTLSKQAGITIDNLDEETEEGEAGAA